jgi:hypothetical protein
MAIPIDDEDFVPLTGFRLHWRFSGRQHGAMSDGFLQRIRPLSEAAASRLGPSVAAVSRDAGSFAATFRSDDTPDVVRNRLRELPPAASDIVLVSWDERTAVVTDWDCFVTYWDDFCYPSADDVTVLPLEGDWMVCYRHYEAIQFRPRSNGA